MEVSVSEAKSVLTELVKRAEDGEDVVLTRHGKPAVRLVKIVSKVTSAERGAVLAAVRASGRQTATPGPDAARSQDFLYGEDGLPV